MSKSVAIIGSGVSGLAAAVRLSNAGFKVRVLEKADTVGGKMNEYRKEGFRFDTGPSLFTMPHFVDELFHLCDEKPEDYIEIMKPEISCKYFYPNQLELNAWQDIDKFAEEIHQKLGEEKSQVTAFLKHSDLLYTLTAPVFILGSFSKRKNLWSKAALKVLTNVFKLDPFKTMHAKNANWFKNKKSIQLFDRYATYNGSNPYTAPATLNIIPHLEHNIGAFLPKGGIYQIANSLKVLAEKQGVIFTTNANVEEIITQHNTAVGLRVEGGEVLHADAIVSDVDVYNLYKKLLPKHQLPWHYRNRELSSSALIFYWGVQGNYPQLDVHNILFADQYKDEFDALFKLKELQLDPTIYIYISSKLIKSDAPKNAENWFVMINVPHNIGQDWDAITHKARIKIQEKIKRILNIDVKNKIMHERVLDPIRIEKKTDSFRGALYGPSSNSKISAFIRHPNFTNRIKNLYFAGGSVHPGGGIPLCLASAKIISEEIIDKHSS